MLEKKDDELLKDVRRALVKYDKEKVLSLLNECLDAGFSPNEIAEKALMSPFHEVIERFRVEDIYFPEFLLVSDALNAAMNLLLPQIKASSRTQVKAKVVLGTVRGDIHDMGKGVVRITLEYGGYEVIDLGSDVPTNEFVKVAREEKADVVALSTLMTPTLRSMAKVVSELKQQTIEVRTIIGGWATSPEFAQEIGADAWAKDALEGLSKLDSLILKNE